jgi:hypothetical protein
MNKAAGSLASLALGALLLTGGTASAQDGELLVCENLNSLDDPATALLLDLLGVPAGSLTDQVGVNCMPYSGGEVGSGELVRCANNSFNGVVALGCVPVEV